MIYVTSRFEVSQNTSGCSLKTPATEQEQETGGGAAAAAAAAHGVAGSPNDYCYKSV
jgi:hypothetical protein